MSQHGENRLIEVPPMLYLKELEQWLHDHGQANAVVKAIMMQQLHFLTLSDYAVKRPDGTWAPMRQVDWTGMFSSVNDRTVLRYLAQLKEAGWIISEAVEDGGFYKNMKRYRVADLAYVELSKLMAA
jgi:DNA-binding PadR family transcriptional regulator